MRLLMATADEELGQIVQYWLGGHGLEVHTARDGEQALRMWHIERPELALVDVNLLPEDGIAVCRQLLGDTHSGLIIVLTRPGHRLDDDVRALEAGASVSVGNPFSPAVLLARVRALARRASVIATIGPRGDGRTADSVMRVGPLALDGMRHEVTCARGRVRLTPIESRLLQVLMTNAGQVLPTTLLVERVWGYDTSDTVDSAGLVKTHMRHLRQKVEVDPGAPRHLVTVPGCGYSFISRPPTEAGVVVSEPANDRAQQWLV